jgi:predicted MPP superfamily phosphohydrolase
MTLPNRKLLKRALDAALLLSVPATALAAYAAQVETSSVEITHQTIWLPRLPVEFDGYTIVQISDWHLGEGMTVERMLNVAKQIDMLMPDVLVLTGDMVGVIRPETLREMRRSLAALSARDGVFAILGNHDHYEDADRVVSSINMVGNCRLLRNENAAIRRGKSTLYLAGLDDLSENYDDLDTALDGIPDGAAVILLAHEPDFAAEAANTGRVGLQLSGHTHGGQVRAPIFGALILPEWGQIYDQGLYDVNGMALYVNRGLGAGKINVRFNCRPEITQFTLRSPDCRP